MLRWTSFALVLFSCYFAIAEEPAVDEVLSRIERKILKEPEYSTKPKYCLLALRTDASVLVWIVEDGKRLFLDRNANGDLTDDGPAIEPSEVRDLGKDPQGRERWDFNYQWPEIVSSDAARHKGFDMARWNYGEGDQYNISLMVDGQIPMYAGWFGTIWSDRPETAPIVHFGGPLTPKKLRGQEFELGGPKNRLSIHFRKLGLGDGATSRLNYEALPLSVIPKVNIEWPVAEGSAPLKTSHLLTERCCYWEYYTNDFQIPSGVVEGKAKMEVDLPLGALPYELTTTVIEVPVVAKKSEGE